MEMLQERKRRSEKLTKEEVRAFAKYVATFPTKIDAAFAIGISRPTLDLVLLRGSGNSDTVGKIRAKINLPEQVRA